MTKIPITYMPSTNSKIEPDDQALADYREIMELIGEMTTAWATLDHDLVELIARLMNADRRAAGVAYFAINSFSARLNIIKALAKHAVKDQDDGKAIIGVMKKLATYANVRNEIVHSAYALTISDTENGRKLRRKQVIHRHTFRSERDQLHTRVKAQTGEIRQNIKNVDAVRSWIRLFIISFATAPRSSGRAPASPA